MAVGAPICSRKKQASCFAACCCIPAASARKDVRSIARGWAASRGKKASEPYRSSMAEKKSLVERIALLFQTWIREYRVLLDRYWHRCVVVDSILTLARGRVMILGGCATVLVVMGKLSGFVESQKSSL